MLQLRTLQEITGHREQVAKLLGISPRALHYKLKRFGIEEGRRSGPPSDEPGGGGDRPVSGGR
ncbi:MAG: helix-turn-helix domain-containing protein [Candidatus Methylomirabilales bacterium]